jgi:hypothetical protein
MTPAVARYSATITVDNTHASSKSSELRHDELGE